MITRAYLEHTLRQNTNKSLFNWWIIHINVAYRWNLPFSSTFVIATISQLRRIGFDWVWLLFCERGWFGSMSDMRRLSNFCFVSRYVYSAPFGKLRTNECLVKCLTCLTTSEKIKFQGKRPELQIWNYVVLRISENWFIFQISIK